MKATFWLPRHALSHPGYCWRCCGWAVASTWGGGRVAGGPDPKEPQECFLLALRVHQAEARAAGRKPPTVRRGWDPSQGPERRAPHRRSQN